MPLWSKKNSSSQDGRATDEAPSEHTRLLPNRVDSGEVEQIEPPNLSPYQDTGVKIAWITTIVFTVLTAVWWLILFISTFLTISRLHSPGSIFFGFSYTSIALSLLTIHLVFFAAPAKLIRILGFVMAVSQSADDSVYLEKVLTSQCRVSSSLI
jgi:uncharacterized protein DUF2417